MRVVNYTQFRGKLASYMNEAATTDEEILVTRGNDAAVIVVSIDHWQSLQETLHLLRSSANVAQLEASMQELEDGKAIPFDPTQAASSLPGRKQARKVAKPARTVAKKAAAKQRKPRS